MATHTRFGISETSGVARAYYQGYVAKGGGIVALCLRRGLWMQSIRVASYIISIGEGGGGAGAGECFRTNEAGDAKEDR